MLLLVAFRGPAIRLSTRALRPALLAPPRLVPRRQFWSLFSGNKQQDGTKVASAVGAQQGAVKRAYGQRLLFYYTGRRTVYIGVLKLYTVLLFSFCTLIVAPSMGFESEYGALAPVGIVIGAAIPLVFVQYLSPPYVTHAYIHLPPFARHSKDNLYRYAKTLPKEAELSLATIRWLGRPKLTKVKVGELQLTRKRFGCVNVEWKRPTDDKRIPFFLDSRGSPGKVSEPGIFREIIRAVLKHSEGTVAV